MAIQFEYHNNNNKYEDRPSTVLVGYDGRDRVYATLNPFEGGVSLTITASGRNNGVAHFILHNNEGLQVTHRDIHRIYRGEKNTIFRKDGALPLSGKNMKRIRGELISRGLRVHAACLEEVLSSGILS